MRNLVPMKKESSCDPPWTGQGTTGQAEEVRAIEDTTDSGLGAAGDEYRAQPGTCF